MPVDQRGAVVDCAAPIVVVNLPGFGREAWLRM